MAHKRIALDRRSVLKGAAAGAAATVFAPNIVAAQNKVIRIGMPTVLSGRVATLGISSRNAIQMEVEKINAAGGLAGRQIEMVVRDSKGQPQEAARVARELVNSDGCEILLDAEASSGSFAVQEVAKDLGVLVMHTNSETSSLTADPKIRIPLAFRSCRQGIHDAVVSGAYAAEIAKAKKINRWGVCSPDYAYGRDNTELFIEYLKHFYPQAELTTDAWPKLFQADYTEVITKVLQAKPQALYSALWGGDLTSWVDQAGIYALFSQMEVFAINMADYTVLTAVKNLPKGIHSATRYITTYPNTKANAEWGEAYRTRFKEYPTNWSWENSVGINFIAEASKKANSADGKKIAEVMRGLKIESPFGADGTITMRAEDQTVIGYAIGWGTTIPAAPYVPEVTGAKWETILELEADWKKRKNYT